MNINLFEIQWAKKGGVGGRKAYGEDVYVSINRKGIVYIGFRNNCLKPSINNVTVARFGDMLLIKGDKAGWKLSPTKSLMETRSIQIRKDILPNDIQEWIERHNHEGFKMNYDVKTDIYYIGGQNE